MLPHFKFDFSVHVISQYLSRKYQLLPTIHIKMRIDVPINIVNSQAEVSQIGHIHSKYDLGCNAVGSHVYRFFVGKARPKVRFGKPVAFHPFPVVIEGQQHRKNFAGTYIVTYNMLNRQISRS